MVVSRAAWLGFSVSTSVQVSQANRMMNRRDPLGRRLPSVNCASSRRWASAGIYSDIQFSVHLLLSVPCCNARHRHPVRAGQGGDRRQRRAFRCDAQAISMARSVRQGWIEPSLARCRLGISSLKATAPAQHGWAQVNTPFTRAKSPTLSSQRSLSATLSEQYVARENSDRYPQQLSRRADPSYPPRMQLRAFSDLFSRTQSPEKADIAPLHAKHGYIPNLTHHPASC
jgi:hypothetical protein